MATRPKGSVPETIFTEDVKAQCHAALDQLLDQHEPKIRESIEASEDKKLPINFVFDVDASESAPQIEVKMRFTAETVTDKRTIKYTDPNQHEFRICSPAQLEAEAAELKQRLAAEKAKEQAESGEGSDGAEEAPKKKGRKSKKTEDANDE